MTNMDSDNLSFLDDNQSVASTVTQLHDYFKNTYSRLKVKRAQLVSKLETTSGEEAETVLQALNNLDSGLSLFGALSDSLSIADRLLHTRAVMDLLGLEGEIYQIHHETEEEQERERSLRQRQP